MKSTMLFARYILFGLFVVCNAIICTVAVWNHSLVQATGGQTVQVDVYLIFLGAFSLAFIFPIIFADILCTDPFSSRVWIECAWVALIWLMQLAGAAAVTAIAPRIQCSAQVNWQLLFVDQYSCSFYLDLYCYIASLSVSSSHNSDYDTVDRPRRMASQCSLSPH
ncbi:hypothetical protein BD769DRAFT_714123 [Suillus cothurnatus]|nr:hypothetical protein BD769DRAFT_714123 [Suillus cothurnatus]